MNQLIKEKMLQWAQQKKYYFCGNEWVKPSSDREFLLLNPADQTEVSRFHLCDSADVDRCVDQARKAFKNKVYLDLPMRQRARLLRDLGQVIRDNAAELAALETLCNGKLYKTES